MIFAPSFPPDGVMEVGGLDLEGRAGISQKVLEGSRRFQKVPEGSGRFQNLGFGFWVFNFEF